MTKGGFNMEMSVQEGTFHINGVQVDGIKKLELKNQKMILMMEYIQNLIILKQVEFLKI